MLCQMRCQITEAVPHCLHLVKKLTIYCAEGDVGSPSDRCVEPDICATIIDRGHLMDPITFLLLFNITVWLYWTLK